MDLDLFQINLRVGELGDQQVIRGVSYVQFHVLG